MQLNEVMSRTVQVIGPHESLASAQRRMRHSGIHHLVVVHRDLIMGLLTQDVLVRRREEGATKVEDAMLRNIITGTPDMTVREAADLMTTGHAQTALPVVLGQHLVGIVTLSDLLSLVGKTRRHARGASMSAG
jgi:CBS domain-containing protein